MHVHWGMHYNLQLRAAGLTPVKSKRGGGGGRINISSFVSPSPNVTCQMRSMGLLVHLFNARSCLALPSNISVCSPLALAPSRLLCGFKSNHLLQYCLNSSVQKGLQSVPSAAVRPHTRQCMLLRSLCNACCGLRDAMHTAVV